MCWNKGRQGLLWGGAGGAGRGLGHQGLQPLLVGNDPHMHFYSTISSKEKTGEWSAMEIWLLNLTNESSRRENILHVLYNYIVIRY